MTTGLASLAHAAGPTYGGCPVFPADNYWNSRIDALPVHASSAAWVNAIGASTQLHPDFSANLADGFGFTPRAVPGSQPLVPIAVSDPAHSDAGPFPIPPELATGSGSREVSVTETTTCSLYEFYGAPVGGGTSWTAGVAAKWSLGSNALRPDGWESGDHAGFPYLAGLLRWEEVAGGEIAHAVRVTAQNFSSGYLWPARHGAGTNPDASLPPMGARFRLKASFDISGFDANTQVVLRAFKKYGLVLASPGGNWFLQGVSDPGWSAVIDQLRSIAGSNFEAVDTAPLRIDANSGQAVQLAPSGGSGGGGVTNPSIAQVFDRGVVIATAVQPDGKVIIGGEFAYVNGVPRNNIARLNADGTLDTAWNPGASSYVSALAVDASGNVYAGGNFQTIAGQSRDFIAKLLPGGTADAGWNPGANNPVFALTLDASGNLYAGGDFNSIGGQARNRIARLSASGAVDSWNPGADAIVFAVAADGAGNVFVGGRFSSIGGVARNYLAKLSAGSGAADAAWNPAIDTGGNNGIHALVLNGGTVYAGGEFFSIGGQSRAYLARFPTTGSGAFDASWNAGAGSTVYALASDGANLYVGGSFNSIGGQGRNGAARIPLGGATADGWNPFTDGPVRALALGGGNVYVGGDFVTIGGQTRGGFAAISSATGAALAGWPTVFNSGELFAILRDAGGRTVIGGRFVAMGDAATLRSNIARFNADGSLDATWNPNSNGHVAALAQDASGNIYVGGYFSFIGGQTRGYLARLSSGGTGAADSWNPSADYIVWTLATDAAGNVYAGGYFSAVGGQGRNRIAKISAAGDVDAGWNPNANGTVLALAADAGGNLFVGGDFTSIGGLARSRLAKLSTGGAGTADAAWNADASDSVLALALDGGGNLYAGGAFATVGGIARRAIAKLSAASGAVDATWNPAPDFTVHALKLDGSGSLYVGGDFNAIGGSARTDIAKIAASGTGAADAGWDPGADGTVRALALDASGNVHAGGAFTRMAGVTRLGYAVIPPGTTGGSGGGGSGGGGGGGTGGGTGGGSGGGSGGGGIDPFPGGGAMPSGWMQPAGSAAPWVVANDAAYQSALSLKSGFIGAGQRSEVSVTRNFATGSVEFARKVSSQAGRDTLQFFIDGVAQAEWSGEQDWAVVSYPIPAGTHTLLWRYAKGGSGSSGSDAAWIDSVSLPPLVQCIERRCSPK